ncbi:Uncharacterised protein [Vibrio cholerae]|nr:Uncharacterised protein [Vibrio cholerae]CSD11174.1 Uncharacterised protein [Vibrio cholerae]
MIDQAIGFYRSGYPQHAESLRFYQFLLVSNVQECTLVELALLVGSKNHPTHTNLGLQLHPLIHLTP